jgi:hypothetical protein
VSFNLDQPEFRILLELTPVQLKRINADEAEPSKSCRCPLAMAFGTSIFSGANVAALLIGTSSDAASCGDLERKARAFITWFDGLTGLGVEPQPLTLRRLRLKWAVAAALEMKQQPV